MYNTILIICILKEMKDLGYNVKTVSPAVLCTLFEKNIGELILAQDPAMRLETKHIIAKYQNFHTYFFYL